MRRVLVVLAALVTLVAAPTTSAFPSGAPSHAVAHDPRGDATANPPGDGAPKPSDDLRLIALTRTSAGWTMAFRSEGFSAHVGERTTVGYDFSLVDPQDSYHYLRIVAAVAGCTDHGCVPVQCDRFWLLPDRSHGRWVARLESQCFRQLTFDPHINGERDRQIDRNDGSTAHRADEVAWHPPRSA